MSEIEVFRDESPTDSSDPPAAVQSTSDPQDNSTEPVAAIRGRQPSRTTAANASKRRSPPSPSPPRQQPPSPASSHAPSAENWTVAEIRQVLTSAGVIIPRRSSKSDLLALYNSLQSGEFLNSSPPLESATTASKSRKSPYSRPGPIFTPSRTGLRPPNRSSRPSASLGRAPDTAALSPHLPRASTERQLATQPSEVSAFASTSRLTRTSTPPSAAYSYTQPRTNEPLPYPWPAAPPLTASPTPSAQAPAPVYPPPLPPPPLSPSTKLFQAQTYPNHRPKHQPFPPLFHAVSSVPEPPFLFLPPRLYPYLQRISTGTTPRSQLHQVHQVTNPTRNSEHWHRRQIYSPPQYLPFQNWYSLKPSLETSPRSLPQFNSPSSLPKDPPVIPDSMEKLQNFSLHL